MQQYTGKDSFCVFGLANMLPGHTLLVNVSFFILSLSYFDSNHENCIIAQRILTEGEMHMLLPLLENPTCCKPEVLQASYSCTSELLLQALFSSDVSTSKQWNELVQQQRDLLRLASEQKAKRTKMKGIYNALYSLRRKLEQLGLTIRVREGGYYLAPL